MKSARVPERSKKAGTGRARAKAFSPTWIDSLRPHAQRRDFTEPGRRGFMLRVWPGGDKTFVYRYMRDGKTRIMNLGTYPAVTLKEAHDSHTEALRDLQAGQDPIEAREQRAAEAKRRHEREQAELSGRMTIEQLVREFVKRGLVRRDGKPYSEPEQVENHLHRALLGRRFDRQTQAYVYDGATWSDRPLDEFTIKDAHAVSDALIDKGSPGSARAVRRSLKAMFDWAEDRGYLAETPLKKLKGGKTPKVDRYLKREEIKALWDALSAPDAPMAEDSRLALKLLLVTGQRPGELCGAKWDSDVKLAESAWGAESDLKTATWRIPAELSKSRREHTIPLSPLAVDLFKQLKELHPKSKHVIPAYLRTGNHDGTRPRDPHSLPHGVRDNGYFGLEPWTPRDLRRTFQTHLMRLGVSGEVRKQIVNHKREELEEVYVHYDFEKEMILAMRKWDQELRRIVSGDSNVVPMQRKGA